MNPRWAGLTSPFRWLVDAFDVGRHQPSVVVGAIVATSLIGFLPSLPPQTMIIAGAPPPFALQAVFQVIALLMAVAITPVLTAGVYRIIDGAEQGQPVAVQQIFSGFRDGSWGRLVICTVLSLGILFAIALVMLVTMAVVAGPETLQSLQQWMEQISALQASAADGGKAVSPAAMPPPPAGLGGIVAVMLAFAPLWTIVALGVGWALVSVALRDEAPVAAVLGGLRAAFINALPVLLFALALLLPALLVGMLVGLLMAALAAVGALIAPAVGALVTFLLVVLMSIVIAAISYGFVLNGWRAACDDGVANRPTPSDVAGFEA